MHGTGSAAGPDLVEGALNELLLESSKNKRLPVNNLPVDLHEDPVGLARAGEILDVASTDRSFCLLSNDHVLWDQVVAATILEAVRSTTQRPEHVAADCEAVAERCERRATNAVACPRATKVRAWLKLGSVSRATAYVAAAGNFRHQKTPPARSSTAIVPPRHPKW